MKKVRWGLFLVLILAGCNFAIEDENPQPTLGTPILWAGSPTPTAEASATPAATPTSVPPTASATPPPTFTPIPPNPTVTPAPTITNTPLVLPSIAAITSAPPTVPNVQTVPTVSVAPTVAGVPTVSAAPTITIAPPATFTPVIQPTQTTAVTAVAAAPAAKVCAECGNLRLRSSPGTAGTVLTYLGGNTPVTVIGRTTDNAWVQIVLADGVNGWVSARYLEITLDLSLVSITGETVDTSWPTAVPAISPSGVEVITGITSHAREIFLDGQAKGNLPGVFSKVGDSITVAPYFFHQFIDVYNLGDYGYLGPVMRFFYGPNGRGGNPFASNSIAAGNGWSTASVLNPPQADPNVCRGGETPLQCEYRVTRPSVALIMLGTNDSGGLPLDQFQGNLNRIVEISISMGVIPVLSTIPPMRYEPGRDARIAEYNNIIVATARTYDVPLWNYWRVMMDLPSSGLGFDGVHPSASPDGFNAHFDANHLKYGYTMRNLTGLQVLYELWRQVLYDATPGGTGNPIPTQPVIDPGAGPTSAPGSCTGAAQIGLAVGGQGQVTPGLPNKVRSSASLSAAQVGTIPGDGIFSVVGGPSCADGYEWWQVNYNGLVGWTAGGTTSDPWIKRYP